MPEDRQMSAVFSRKLTAFFEIFMMRKQIGEKNIKRMVAKIVLRDFQNLH